MNKVRSKKRSLLLKMRKAAIKRPFLILVNKRYYFTASFKLLPALKAGVLVAGICKGAPV